MFTRTICHGRCFSVLNVVHYSFLYGEIAFQGIVNLKTCREIEIETERLDDMLLIRKKRTKERAKKCSWRENWYVLGNASIVGRALDGTQALRFRRWKRSHAFSRRCQRSLATCQAMHGDAVKARPGRGKTKMVVPPKVLTRPFRR